MSFDDIRSGAVIRYPYLWDREPNAARQRGRKGRPTAVGLRLERPNGGDVLILFPIASKEPETGRLAVEIPEIEKRRSGLSIDMRLWIILDEANQDQIGRSFYLMPRA